MVKESYQLTVSSIINELWDDMNESSQMTVTSDINEPWTYNSIRVG